MATGKYRNEVYLRGVIADGFAYKKTKEGKEFATFLLEMNNIYARVEDRTAQDNIIYLRVMVFDTRLVRYLKENSAHPNDNVFIVARLNAHKVEYKGVSFYQTDILANDIVLTRKKTSK